MTPGVKERIASLALPQHCNWTGSSNAWIARPTAAANVELFAQGNETNGGSIGAFIWSE